jgi:hypothetical protein
MSKALLFTLALVFLASASLTRNHDYWYTAGKTGATSGVPMGDVAWNYCDMKCTYLEKYYPGSDFVVIPFTESAIKPDFAACYIASTSATGTTTYALWNTVAKNTYYDSNCGGDSEDYYAGTQGASPKYKVSGTILGVGIGTEITY